MLSLQRMVQNVMKLGGSAFAWLQRLMLVGVTRTMKHIYAHLRSACSEVGVRQQMSSRLNKRKCLGYVLARSSWPGSVVNWCICDVPFCDHLLMCSTISIHK